MSDFYSIIPAGDGLADVILTPPEGGLYIVRGVPCGNSLEADVRARYTAYLASAEPAG